MRHRSAALKDFWNTATDEVYDTASKYAKQLKKSYPSVASDVRSTAQSATGQAQHALSAAGHQLGAFALGTGQQLRRTEGHLLRIGFIYAVYKLFIADDKQVYEATNKAKACVREKPVESVLIAFAAGFIFGKLL